MIKNEYSMKGKHTFVVQSKLKYDVFSPLLLNSACLKKEFSKKRIQVHFSEQILNNQLDDKKKNQLKLKNSNLLPKVDCHS